jgi:hypothetical protein
MRVGDRVIFESASGELLRELGYETEGLGRPIGMHERLFWSIQDYYHFVDMRLNRRYMKAWLLDELFLRWADIRGGIKMDKLLGKISPIRKG